ncbi:MAG: YHS domain-containing protein [Pirellulaceae bacterium]|nr:YHS domain-containing protein [Pirellulaceae bacterium]
MSEVATRSESFVRVATSLTNRVIRPLLETLGGSFPNTSPIQAERDGQCSYWFGFCERFPPSTKVSFSIDHDVPFEKAEICFEATMMPVFVKLNDRDKLVFPLDRVNENAVVDWVEERLLEFLHAYLRIDRGADDFDEDAASDPVCGMRISRSQAVSNQNFNGHPYFFCSSQCAERFRANPASFLQTTTDCNQDNT